MKYFYSLFLLLTITIHAQVSQQWAARYNGVGDYTDKVNCMVRDASGNLYLGGYSTRSGNQKDFLVMKLSPIGDTLWTRTFDGTNHAHDEALAIALDPNGFVVATGYVSGNNTGSDIFLVKLNLVGDTSWTRTYNYTANENDQANAIAVDNSGNIVVTGQSDNDPTTSGNDDYITIRYTPAGAQVFAARYDGPMSGTDDATSVVFQANGNAVVTGRSYGLNFDDDFMTISYTPAGAIAWSVIMDGGQGNDRAIAMTEDASGNLYVTGQSDNGQDYDYCIEAYNSLGLFLWEDFYDNIAGNDYPSSIALDNSGNVIITGKCDNDPSFLTSYDIVTISYTTSGTQTWVSTYNGTANGNDEGAALATDLSGNVFVEGKTDINPNAAITNYDYVTLKYSSAGTQLWAQTSGPPNSLSDGGVAVTTDATGNCIVSGNAVNTGTAKDIRTIEYSSAGVLQWLKEYSGSGDHTDFVNAMTTDASGNSYMAGYTYSSNNKRDMCVVKINSIGDTVWVRTIDGSLHVDDEANAVVVDGSGNVFITGFTKDTITGNNYCTAKYNSAGTLLWFLKYNFAAANGTDRATAMALTAAGDIIVTGESDNDPTAVTNYDIATVKYSTTGFLQWTTRYMGPGNLSDKPNAISLNSAGEIVIAGKTGVTALNDDALILKLNSAGVIMWSRIVPSTYGNDDATCITQDAGGNIAVGIQSVNSSLNDDIHVWYSDSAGNNWWNTSFNGTGNGNDRPAAIAFDGSQDVIVTGQSDADTAALLSNYNIVTIKYNSNGVQQWVKTYDGIAGDDDKGAGIAVDNSTGYIYVTGQCNNGSILVKNNDIVLLQYDPAGNQLLTGTYDGAGASDGPYGIIIRGTNIYVSGSSVGAGNNQKDMVMLLYTGFNVGIAPAETENTISVFPNPCHDFTEVHFTEPAQHRMITISDMSGKIVLSQEANSDKIRIETSTLAPGVYLGTVFSSDESTQQFKIIVQ